MISHIREKNDRMLNAEKRGFNRIPVDIDAKFFHGNMFYSANLRNLSDHGMLIATKKRLPLNSMFVVVIREEDHLLNVIVKVKWTSPDADTSSGMGVELISPPSGYLNLIHSV